MTVPITPRKGGKVIEVETGYDHGAAVAGPFAGFFASHFPGGLITCAVFAASLVMMWASILIAIHHDLGILIGLPFVLFSAWVPAIVFGLHANAIYHAKITNGKYRVVAINDDAVWNELKTIENWRVLL